MKHDGQATTVCDLWAVPAWPWRSSEGRPGFVAMLGLGNKVDEKRQFRTNPELLAYLDRMEAPRTIYIPALHHESFAIALRKQGHTLILGNPTQFDEGDGGVSYL